MKKNDKNAMKNKDVAELRKEADAIRAKLVDLKFDLVAGKVKNVREIRAAKKNLARILTLVNEKSAE